MNRIKNKNFKEICIAIKNRIKRYSFLVSKPIIDLFPVSNKIICFESEPDFSDNSFAFYYFASQKNAFEGYKIVWFLHNLENREQARGRVICVDGRNVRNIRSYYYLRRCKYYLFDHNNLMNSIKVREGQTIFAFSHGAGFKGCKKWNSKITYASTLSPFSFDHIADFVGCNSNQILDLGYPRNDWLFAEYTKEQIEFAKKHNFEKFDKIIFWMPTYRKSTNKTISEEYFNSETGLPILKTDKHLESFNSILKSKNILCVFKVHHLQAKLDAYAKTYTNIMVLNDDEIINSKIQLYQTLAFSDALITDYSSISVDYLMLNKPMIFTLDDYEEYKNSRGFYYDNTKEYLGGYHVHNEQGLYSAIDEALFKSDIYEDKRKALKKLFYTYPDGHATDRILSFLNIKNEIKQKRHKDKQTNNKKYKIGYTQGVYDMFHVGHLNLLNQAKQLCDYLIVGVNSDELVQSYKNKTPIVNESDRKKIVENIKAVDECIIVTTLDKIEILKEIKFDAVFIGDDWLGNPRWVKTQKDLEQYNVDVVFLKHTDGISSTFLRSKEDKKVSG